MFDWMLVIYLNNDLKQLLMQCTSTVYLTCLRMPNLHKVDVTFATIQYGMVKALWRLNYDSLITDVIVLPSTFFPRPTLIVSCPQDTQNTLGSSHDRMLEVGMEISILVPLFMVVLVFPSAPIMI